MVRHTHQDALSDPEFETLLEAAAELDESFQTGATLTLIAGDWFGMRGNDTQGHY